MARIITSGCTFVDIDAVACAVALYEAYDVLGEKEVFVHLSENLSSSVTPEMRKRLATYPQKDIVSGDQIILVDVSDQKYLQHTCQYELDDVIAIFDHHPGDESFWRKKIGAQARVEPLGAAATLMYEFLQEQNVYTEMSRDAKKMLAQAIMQNTQNFHVAITSPRDHRALAVLEKDLGLQESWREAYFREIDRMTFDDPQTSLENDFKPEIVIRGDTWAIAQCELFEAEKFLTQYKSVIREMLERAGTTYNFYLSASIKEGKTFFYTEDKQTQKLLYKVCGLVFEKGIAVYEKVTLRKEILQKLQDDAQDKS